MTAMQELIYLMENDNLPLDWKDKFLNKEQEMIKKAYTDGICNGKIPHLKIISPENYYIKTCLK